MLKKLTVGAKQFTDNKERDKQSNKYIQNQTDKQ